MNSDSSSEVVAIVATSRPSFSELTVQLAMRSPAEVRKITSEWIVSQGGQSEQLNGIVDIFEQASLNLEGLNEVVMEAWGMLVDGKTWMARFPSREDAINSLDNPQLRDLRMRALGSRNRKEKAVTAIKQKWGPGTYDWLFETLGENYLYNVAAVADQYTFEDASAIVRHITMDRLRKCQTGRGSTRSIISKDWQELRLMEKSEVRQLLLRPPPTASELAGFETTLIQLDQSKRGIANVNSTSESPPRKRRRYHREAVEETTIQDDSDEEMQGDSQDEDTQSTIDSDVEEESEEEDDDAISQVKYQEGCACRGIENSLLERIKRKNAGTSGIKNETECIAALRMVIKSAPRGTNLEHVCHKHLHALAGHFGLQVKKLNTPALRSRLLACWQNRGDLDAFKVSPAHTTWFRLNSRPWVEDDDHGVYACRAIRKNLMPELTVGQAAAIVDEIGGLGAWATWHEEGNLIVQEMFAWLWAGVEFDGKHEPGIGDLITKEFDLYLHHQRERNAQSNKGWLRTMFYSLSQQIIRQDIEYWTLYACLRPDLNTRLVSYPYYAKYVLPGDPTFFRHIDMNVNKYLEDGHGGNIIQGSVSLDVENAHGCTEIVPGFHNHIENWWKKVKARGRAPNGHVHGLEKIYLKEDIAEYGDFVPVPCQRGGVRMTMPEILHGSTHNNGGVVRRTILPWFVAVSDNGQTLDNEESDSWADIARAHSTQEALNLTPSGLANRFGPIPYRFPPSTQLHLDSPISQALCCRTTWADPMVQAQANLVLGADRQRARRIIDKHRFDALRAFKSAFQVVRISEGMFYGEDSFFK